MRLDQPRRRRRRRCGSRIEPFATTLDAWHMESFRTEWWKSFRLPVNWKLAQEAFLEQYHVIETHPELVIPGRYPPRDPTTFDPRTFVDSELHYLQVMSNGMAGMVHANDVAIAEGLRDIELPADPTLALSIWNRTLNDAVAKWHRDAGSVIPDLNELEDNGLNQPMGFCFPHFFVLPMYSSASSYRFRPLGPEETLMEIWSLTRYPEGTERQPVPPPEPIALSTTPGCPPSPPRTSRTCPVSNGACTTRASSTCAWPPGWRAAWPTSSAPSTASWPASPTSSCFPPCTPSTSTRSSGRLSTSDSEAATDDR